MEKDGYLLASAPELRERVSELRVSLEASQENVGRLSSEKHELARKLREERQASGRLLERLTAARAELAAAGILAEAAATFPEQEASSFQRQLSLLQERERAAVAECDELRRQIRAAQESSTEAEAAARGMNSVEPAADVAAALREEIGRLQDALTTAIQLTEAAEFENSEMKSKRTDAERERDRAARQMQDELESANRIRRGEAALQERIADLVSENRRLVKENDDIREQLAQDREMFKALVPEV